MRPMSCEPIETRTGPVGLADPEDGSSEIETIDEGLHFGRAWHRYRYCYPRARSLRMLDAGCGTGRSSVWAARLNPGASVLGIEAAAAAIAAARGRADGTNLSGTVEFRVHDPTEPLPEDWGRFDFVICRGRLARAADPTRLLINLARTLTPDGLLLVSVPSHAAREVARSFRRAIETLATPGAGVAEQVEVGLELLRALRPDHPIRVNVARSQYDINGPGAAERVVAGFLSDRHDWTFDEADAMIAGAGLKLLYAATPWRWRPERVFAPDVLPNRLIGRINRLAPDRLGRLIDALDRSLLDEDYQLYTCLVDYSPPTPDWPVTRFDNPRRFDDLVPQLTGLAEPSRFLAFGAQGRVSYQTISGTLGELDRWSHLLLGAVDGSTSCGEIERKLSSQTRASDDPLSRQERWIDLADSGLILLKPSTP